MPLPDRIERVVDLAHPPEAVWRALTTAEGLGRWFGTEARIDLRPGGRAHVAWGGDDRAVLRIETVEPPHRFAFTWPVHNTGPDGPHRTRVEFTLQPTAAGTRLRMVESGFAHLPDDLGHARPANTAGWARALPALAGHLDVAA